MAIDFPSSPSVGQVFQGYTYDGTAWNMSAKMDLAITSDTPPSNPVDGQLWWKASTCTMYIWYNDGNSKQWVQTAASPQMVDNSYSRKTAWQKNLLVNPAMVISQQNLSDAGNTHGYYPVDQWNMGMIGPVCSIQQVASLTSDRSVTRIRKTVTTLKASLAATDWSGIGQAIEGNRLNDIGFGTASACQLMLRFGFKAPAGTYSFALRNNPNDRSYVKNFTISAAQANTDTLQTFAIPGDITGSWAMTNALGMALSIVDGVGTTYQGVEGWQTGNFIGTSANSNMVATNGNVVELFDVGLYPDPDKTGIAPPFIAPLFNDALWECQRYCEKSHSYGTKPGANTGLGQGIAEFGMVPSATSIIGFISFKTPKRVPPAVQVYDPIGGAGYVGTNGANNAQVPTAVDNMNDNGFKVFMNNCTRLSFHWWVNARM